jgi:hypothetical protein
MSELDRVYACLKNSGGGDGVRSRDTDFGVPGNEPWCGSIRIEACSSSGDTNAGDWTAATLEAIRGWYPFSFVTDRGKNILYEYQQTGEYISRTR